MLALLCAASPALASDTPDASPPSAEQAQPQATSGPEADAQIYQEAVRLYQSGDATNALLQLKRFMETPTFLALPEDRRQLMRPFYFEMAVGAGQASAVISEIKAASAQDTTGDYWMVRMFADGALQDGADSLYALTTVARRWPARLTQWDDESVFVILRQTSGDKALKAKRFDAILALYEAPWKPRDPLTNLDGVKLDLALELAERGDAAKAKKIAAEITTPNTVAEMRYARRYSALLSPELARRDLSQLAEAQTQAIRRQIDDAPDKLANLALLGKTLMSRGRLAEALSVLDDGIGKATGPQAFFTDMEALSWLYDAKSQVLLFLGRGDEAIAAMKAGAARPEHGSDNVSQQLNLASLYIVLGRSREALAAAEAAGDHLSGYGRMVLEGEKAEACFQLHDEAGLKTSLDYMKAHADDGPLLRLDTLMETGQDDEAARYLIQLLGDKARQASALSALQDRMVPDTAPDYVKARQRRMKALRERPQVKAAVDAVGRIETLPFIVEL